jgi:hypothetical protein
MENNMVKTAALLVLFSASCLAGPTTGQYSISVHVTASHWLMESDIKSGGWPVERLDVVIDGKKYELQAAAGGIGRSGVSLLNPGDYKAKLVVDVHKTSYESSQIYEFQFSDQKTQRFALVGISE